MSPFTVSLWSFKYQSHGSILESGVSWTSDSFGEANLWFLWFGFFFLVVEGSVLGCRKQVYRPRIYLGECFLYL